ncbi:MAG: hypothetical protein ACTHWM_04310 [Yaniella sp.]|nr:hypothetical protein [Yaniella sp.]
MPAETRTQNQALAELIELLGAAVVTEGPKTVPGIFPPGPHLP